jgi:hypothetical protein
MLLNWANYYHHHFWLCSANIIKTNAENDLYEHELYFISQMFEENWQPRDTIIDRAEGTINDVGMKIFAGNEVGGKR